MGVIIKATFLYLFFSHAFASVLFNSHNREGLDNFVLESSRNWGADESFVKRLNFKYNNNYISQLRFLIINAHINNLKLDRNDHFYKRILENISTFQLGFIIQLFFLGSEIVLLFYLITLKWANKRPVVKLENPA